VPRSSCHGTCEGAQPDGCSTHGGARPEAMAGAPFNRATEDKLGLAAMARHTGELGGNLNSTAMWCGMRCVGSLALTSMAGHVGELELMAAAIARGEVEDEMAL
jgi:hypothetical protein